MRFENGLKSSDAGRIRQDLAAHPGHGLQVVSNHSDTIIVTRGTFGPFAGRTEATPYTKIAVNIGRASWFFRQSAAVRVDSPWRRDGIVVMPAGDPADARSAEVEMIGLAVDLTAFATCGESQVGPDDLLGAAGQITRDKSLTAVVTSIACVAMAHDAPAALLDEALPSLLLRLAGRPPEAPRARVRALDRRSLRQVQELIESRLSDDVSVRDLAEAVDMNVGTFTRSFHRATGATPFVYLTRRRMEKSKQLLRACQSVTETAMELGYANPSKFAAAFRRHVGCSPSAWLTTLRVPPGRTDRRMSS